MAKQKLIIGVIAAVAAIGIGFAFFWDGDEPQRPHDKKSRLRKDQEADKRPVAVRTGYLPELLAKADWTPTAASEIDRLTSECWAAPTEEWASQYPTVVPLLKDLGKHPDQMALIERRPETAFLLLGADDPDRLTKLLSPLEDREYRMVEGWLKQFPARIDADLLLDALERHLSLIIGLAEKNLVGVERIFMFKRNLPIELEYDGWLADVVRADILPGGILDEQRSSLMTFLICQGPAIRARLKSDATFARDFRTKLWPNFVKLAGPDMWDAYAAMPGVWKILRETDGVELMKKYYQLPVLLLASPEAYPDDLNEFIFQALRSEDWMLLAALEKCRKEYHLKELVRKKSSSTSFSDLAFRNIIKRLLSFGPDLPPETDSATIEREEIKASEKRKKTLEQVLGWLNEKKYTTIEEQYGNAKDPYILRQIPGYDIYKLGDKLLDGRDVSAEEVLGAIQDAIDIVPGVGQATKSTVSAMKVASQQEKPKDTETAAQIAERFAQNLARHPTSATARSVAVGNILNMLQGPLREIEKHPQGIDVTPVLRLMGAQSSVGYHSAGNLARWDVHIVYHEAGRVFASIGNDKLPDWPGSKLKEQLAMGTVSSSLRDCSDKEKLDDAWRRNAFAWWAMQFAQRK